MAAAPRPIRILRTLRHRPLRCERIYRQIAADISPKALDEIRARARSVQEHGYERYLDLGWIAVFNESIECFGIERVTHEIQPFEPLPAFDGKPFDLITAFAAKFERYDSPVGTVSEIWGEPEWTYFLNEIRERLAPGGLFHVKLNVMADHFNRRPELRDAFENAKGLEASFLDAKRISFRRVA